MERKLEVRMDRRLAGLIEKGKGAKLSFSYVPEWLNSGFPLSLSLPLREEPYDDAETRAFFDNLLPEQGIRARISKNMHISESNVFGLLEALGGECAGALTIQPEGEGDAGKPGYVEFSRERMGDLIAALPKRPLLAGEDGIRLSLAGAQNKLPVVYDRGKFYLPTNGAPSTHILKPPIDDLPGTVENETFCMSLALLAGLDVPYVEITDTTPRGYLVARYDREVSDSIRRIHQEDFCQALGLPLALKYQNEGGPGPEECFALLDRCADPEADRRRLFNLFVFNFLIGNTDAHAKNLSLLYREPPKPVLAPFYDLLCTQVYVDHGLGTTNSMKIGGTYDPKFVMRRHWLRLADQAGIGHKDALSTIGAMASLLESASPVVAEEFSKRYGKSRVAGDIAEFVRARSQLTLERLAFDT